MTTIHRSAMFSECGQYRYFLRRHWDESLKQVLCIGLNPSVAGSLNKDGLERDDATIRRLMRDLNTLGYGGFYMVNLYALISTKPEKLFSVPDALGDNDYWIAHCAMATQAQIFCFGNFKGTEYRQRKMIELFPDALCFGKNDNGTPMHPRALHYAGIKTEDVKLIKYR